MFYYTYIHKSCNEFKLDYAWSISLQESCAYIVCFDLKVLINLVTQYNFTLDLT